MTSGTVTQRPPEAPAKRDIALRPWIELANAAGRRRPLENEPPRELITTVERQTQTPWFPRSAILALANDPENPDAGWRALDRLAAMVLTALDSLARSAGKGGRSHPRIRLYDQSSLYGLNVDKCGFVRVDVKSPLAVFANALEGTEAARIRRCPICEESLFYAARITRKACSVRCDRALRKRRQREKLSEYEKNRKWNDNARQLRKSGAWLKGKHK